MSAPDSFSAAWAGQTRLAKAGILLLVGFAALLSRLLWPAWSQNPDVSHGLFMPVVFLFLLHHSRAAGPARYLRAGRGPALAAVVLAVAGLVLLCLAGLYAAAVDWSNALVLFLLAAAFTLFLGAALICFSNERIRFLPCNWSSCVAVALWPLSAPIPPGTYTRLTIALQLWVSTGVLHALHLLGVIALRQGNVIQLAGTSVGVEEACSGVRSLVSCVFVGIFLSAALGRRPWARAWIIALAVPLALGMNFVRSLTLTLLANADITIAGTWHDATGYAVLGVTALVLAGLALCLSGGRDGRPARPGLAGTSVQQRTGGPPVPTLGMSAFLTGALALAAILVAFFYLNTRPAVRRDVPVPDLMALLPNSPAGWRVATRTDLYQFANVLQTDLLAQRTYERSQADGVVQITLYLAYWRPGQAPVSLVSTHTPDACMPGTGWIPLPLFPSRVTLAPGGRALPETEARLFVSGAHYPQYVWFWHLYDGRPIPFISPRSLGQLLRIAWLYGFRHDGDQVFVRVSSNRPWAEISDEPFLQEFFSRLQPLGL